MVELGVDLKPPEITVMQPASGTKIEGSKVEVKLRATDFRGSGFDGRTLQFMKRIEEIWSNWTDIPFDEVGEELLLTDTFDLPFGLVGLRFRGSDLMGNRFETPPLFLTMEMPVINKKPVPIIKTPLNNTVFEFGVPIYLSSEGTSDDGIGEHSPVRLTWISSIDGLLGTDRFLDVILKAGQHRITLYADDGAPGHNVSVYVNITVLDPEDDNGTGPIDPADEDGGAWIAFVITLCVMVLLVIAVMVIMVLLTRRREEKETQLWVIEETPDDLEYRKRKRKEDMDRGFAIEDGKDPPEAHAATRLTRAPTGRSLASRRS